MYETTQNFCKTKLRANRMGSENIILVHKLDLCLLMEGNQSNIPHGYWVDSAAGKL